MSNFGSSWSGGASGGPAASAAAVASVGGLAPVASVAAAPSLVPAVGSSSAGGGFHAGVGIAGRGAGAGGGLSGPTERTTKLQHICQATAPAPPTFSGTSATSASLIDGDFSASASFSTGTLAGRPDLSGSLSSCGLLPATRPCDSSADTAASDVVEASSKDASGRKQTDETTYILPPNSKAIRQLRQAPGRGGGESTQATVLASAAPLRPGTAPAELPLKERGTTEDARGLMQHLALAGSVEMPCLKLAIPVQDPSPELNLQPEMTEKKLSHMQRVNGPIVPKKVKSRMAKVKIPDLGHQEMFPDMTGEAVFLRMQELIGNPKAWQSSLGPPQKALTNS